MSESEKHIINEHEPDYEKAEMDLLRDGLKRSDTERFLFLNELIKTQKALQQANVAYKTVQSTSNSFINSTGLEAIIFLKHLHKKAVKYVLAGDFAMCFYGHDIGNGVLEIWVDDTNKNLNRLKAAFIEHKISDSATLEPMQFEAYNNNLHLHNGMRLEINITLKGLEGFPFDECLQQASVADIDGVQVPFLHINHLIANKVAVNRPKDQLDVAELEKIKEIQKKRDSGTKL